MITSYDCPNCGGNLQLGGDEEIVRCRFCGTELSLPERRRRELETERGRIVARDLEWATRIEAADVRTASDLVVPSAGCCGIYAGVFVVASLLLAVAGLSGPGRHRTILAAIAIVSAIAGALLLAWRRDGQRRDRVAALQRERSADRDRDEQRLREIEAELETLR